MKYFEFNSVCDKFTKITNIVDQNLLISYLPFFVAFSLVCLVLTNKFRFAYSFDNCFALTRTMRPISYKTCIA